MNDSADVALEFGGATGSVRALLRAEGAALALACIAGFAVSGTSWWLFAALILAPDLSLIAFAAGRRVGAIVYDIAHTMVGPLLLATGALLFGWQWPVAVALVWGAHIGVDRAIGYGLRYPAGIEYTHLGRVGRVPQLTGGD